MVRIAPVRLSFNPKTLWFDAGDLELHVNDKVVVTTARGSEFGLIASAVFDMEQEETKKLKSPLKPVKRLATDEDVERDAQMAELGTLALPIFKQMAAETTPDMNPVAVEYLFDGDKAVFYFEAEERIDFRDLVRKLAAEFHVRVDMKQIGVRDEARMVGGLGHCGQELCCRRLGGGFDPVSIRMAKEQDLSLNPQKISGICGRLMCCLRYEYEAYKEFHGRAPKKNAKIMTPDGEGKVIDMNVPREIVTIKVGDEKPVKIPLSEFEEPAEGSRPNEVGHEAWDRANEPAIGSMESALSLFTNQLTGEDKLAEPGKVRHVHGEESGSKQGKSRSRRRGGRSKAAEKEKQETVERKQPTRKPRRRRSTTVASDGTIQVAHEPTQTKTKQTGGQPRQGKAASEGGQKRQEAKAEDGAVRKTSSRRRRSRSTAKPEQGAERAQAANTGGAQQNKNTKVGRNSSALRAPRAEAEGAKAGQEGQQTATRRRRRRSHKSTDE